MITAPTEPSHSTSTCNKNYLMVIKWLIALGIPIAIALVPATPILSKNVLGFFAITMWAILAWLLEIIPEVAVGFLLPVLYIVFGIATTKVVFSPWLSNVPWITFGGLVLGYVMMSTGLAKRVALRCILITGGTFNRTLTGLMLAGMIIAPFIPSIMGKIAILSVIGVAICEALELKQKTKAASAVMLTAFLSVASPKLSYLTGGGDIPLGMGLVANVTGTMITWGEYAFHNTLIGFIYCIMSLVLVMVFLKPDQSINSKETIQATYNKLGPMSTDEKKAAITLFVSLVLMATDFIHKIDVGWVMLLISGALFVPGIQLLKADSLRKINFAVMFFITGAMSIGPVAANVGAAKIMANTLFPLLQGSTLHTFISVYVFGIILKFVLTPLAATAMFISPLTEIAINMGLNPYPIVYAFKYGIDQYVFPYEYAVLLYCFSFGYMSLNHVFRVLLPRIVFTGIMLVAIAYPYWKFIGLLK